MSKQLIYSERKTFCFSKQQILTFEKMKRKYRIDASKFVREAIKEKLERDYAEIVKEKQICPFSGMEY